MQPNNNRAPGQADETAGADASRGGFVPGDSFVDKPSGADAAGELPSWLQNFADATGETSTTAKPAESVGSDALPASSWDDPSSGAASQPGQATDPNAQFGQGPASGDQSFFSDDDLPEWLRALSTDSGTVPNSAPVAAVAAVSTTPGGALQVPQVSKAWVTAHEQAEASPGANLLSSLVHVIDSRPDAVAPRSASGPATSSAKAAATATTPTAKTAAQPQPAAAVVTASEPANGAGRWNRTRLLAIAVIAVLILLVIFLLTGN